MRQVTVDGDQELALFEVEGERDGLTYQEGAEAAFGARPLE
jgi:hypothetical protein